MTKTEKEKTERFERWARTLHTSGTNVQIVGEEPPETEQGFLVLTLVDGERGGTKEFVVTDVVGEVVNRKRKRAEYFSAKKEGYKIGVSLEWRSREEAWKNLTDKDIEQINMTVAVATEEALK